MIELCINLVQVDDMFSKHEGIQAVRIVPGNVTFKDSRISVKSSKTLLNTLRYVKDVYIESLYASIQWSKLTTLIQYFRIVNNSFPQPATNEEVYEDLKDPSKDQFYTQGFRIYDTSVVLKTHDKDELISDVHSTQHMVVEDEDISKENVSNIAMTPINHAQPLQLPPGMETVNCLVLAIHNKDFQLMLQ